jgi:hypothetical protein
MKNKTTTKKFLIVSIDPELNFMLKEKCITSGRSRRFIINYLLKKYLYVSSKKLLGQNGKQNEK